MPDFHSTWGARVNIWRKKKKNIINFFSILLNTSLHLIWDRGWKMGSG